MRKRWILYLVLSLMIGRAWGLHLPSMVGQDAPCHGQAVHESHAAGQGHGDAGATSSDVSPDATVSSSSAPADAMQGDGHVCCLILVSAQDWRWPIGLVPQPDRSQPTWTSASRSLDLRPPIPRL